VKKFNDNRANLARGISAAAMAVALTVAAPAYAQTTSTLQGHVEGASAGATVTVTDTTTGRSVTVPVDANGDYVIVGLRPSTYEVSVSGGGEAETVTLPVGETIVYDVAPAAGGEEIVVTGSRGRPETRTATISTNVSTAQIENLPQNDRNFLNFAALAPGVSVSPTSGARRVQAGGVSSDNTNVFIDGLSLKNPINHGGVAGQNFSRGNPFPQLAVQEFRVDTQNFKAEYEQAGSAIITAVTKTGGTEFHGDIFGQWQPKSFIGRPFFDRPGEANNVNGTNPKPDYDRKQYGGDLGGPIIKDKLHFFGAFEATDQKFPSFSVNFSAADNVPAAIRTQYNGTYPQTFKQRLYFGKLSFFATDNDTVNASVFLRRENNLADYGGNSVPEHGRVLTSDIDVYQLEWAHRGENWLNEFTFAYNTVANGTPRTGDGVEIILNRNPANGGEVAFLGTNSFVQNDNQRTYTLKNNATFFGGDHTIKAGAKVTFNKYERLEDSFNNGSYYFNAATYTGFGNETPLYARISTVPVAPASAKNTQIGLFIQDDWTPNEHLTINAGLRWDFETNAKNEDFVTPARVAAALRSYQGWQAAGINPEDYISNGKNRKPYWKAFQPRLGISYDVKGDRDLVFFAGAGRYYDRPLFITAGIETIKNYYQSVSTVSFCNGTGYTAPGGAFPAPAGCVNFTPAMRDPNNLRAAAVAQGLGGDVWLLNNDTKLPFTDQFNIGVRKRFGAVQTSLTFAHNRAQNIFQFVRGNRFSNGWFSRVLQRDALGNVTGCTNGGSAWVIDNFPSANYAACAAQNGQLTGFQGKLNIGANEGKANYSAIYLTVDKPYTKASGWGFTISGTWQDPKTNVGTELGADEFFAGADQNQFGWQYVQGVDKYRLVATGIVGLPWDITLSATGTFASGPSFGFVDFGRPNVPENACCVANLGGVRYPTKDFAYKNVDVRLAKTFRIMGTELTLNAQAFNIFDSVNRNYSSWGAGNSPPNYEENGTVGQARSFEVGASFKF
jgi:outer membrane receptor protein involved in Fe transport